MNTRVNSFGGDLDDFKPKSSPAPKADKEQIDKIAAETGFLSRQPPKQEIVKRRKKSSGRTEQLNIKVTKESLDEFYTIADELGLPLGAVFEKALSALKDIK